MTGLDEKTDSILEVAVCLTDLEFNILEEYSRVVFQPEEVLKKMGSWCRKTHKKSGLTDLVPKGTPLSQVEEELLTLVGKYYGAKEKIVLVGNSVGNDKRFIEKDLPRFAKTLHYRIIDISSFKELFRRKYGFEFKKENGHRAVSDIKESIAELKSYLSCVHVSPKT